MNNASTQRALLSLSDHRQDGLIWDSTSSISRGMWNSEHQSSYQHLQQTLLLCGVWTWNGESVKSSLRLIYRDSFMWDCFIHKGRWESYLSSQCSFLKPQKDELHIWKSRAFKSKLALTPALPVKSPWKIRRTWVWYSSVCFSGSRRILKKENVF